MTSTALDSILRGTGLPEKMWKATPAPVQQLHSPAGAPAISKGTQPLTKQPAPSPEPRAKTASPKTPVPVPVAIPSELRSLAQWVGWKSVENPAAKKPRKLPISPHTGGLGSSTDRATWSDYNTAVAAVTRYHLAGVGFVFASNDPYTGIDLDDCRNPGTGDITDWAREIIAAIDSYTEVSPSMTGVKIFLRGKLAANAKHNTEYATGSVEMYSEGRYFTVTGQHVEGTPAIIEDRQAELTAMYARVFGAQPAPAVTPDQAAPVTEGHRTHRLAQMIGREKKASTPLETIRAMAHALNQTFKPPHDPAKVDYMVDDLFKRPFRADNPPTPFTNFIEDSRPKVRLRGDNRLLSDVASELAPHLSGVLYVHNNEVVEYREGALHPVSAQRFRTFVEKRVIFYRVRSANQTNVQVGATVDEADARGILSAPQFLECLRPLHHLNTVRLPVFRADGRIELLPPGYDAATPTFTDERATYREDMTASDALETILNLFGEFRFSDSERSLAVAVSALVGLYAKQLIPVAELRPAFTFVKNAEGAGATTLVACVIVPVCGNLPTGSRSKDDDCEMRKLITSTLRAGGPVLFLDNVRGPLNSAGLEAFTSAAEWQDRLLGGNEMVRGENHVTVFVTGNGMTISPDWRRRSLFSELHLAEERAEDRTFQRPLSVPILQAMRPRILAACWAMVKTWDGLGRPKPTRSHSAFPAWAATIGGIVECAGFVCPFTTANVSVVADEDGANMRFLTAAMTPGVAYTHTELLDLCRRLDIFPGLVGSSDADVGRAQRSAFGKLLARYDQRQVNDLKFFIDGTGHRKRFRVLGAADVAEQAARETNVEPDESTPRKGYVEDGDL